MVGFTKQEMLTELREIIFQYARITSFVIDAEAGFRMLRCEIPENIDDVNNLMSPEISSTKFKYPFSIDKMLITRTVEHFYDYGLQGFNFDIELVTGNSEWTFAHGFIRDLSQSMLLIESLNGRRISTDKCLYAAHAFFARIVLNGGERCSLEDNTTPYEPDNGLTLREIAILADLDERTIRNATSKNSTNRLETFMYGSGVYVSREVALAWLATKRGFVATRIGDETHLECILESSFTNLEEAGIYIRGCRERLGLSCQDLLKKIKLSAEELNLKKLESGKATPVNEATLKSLGLGLGVKGDLFALRILEALQKQSLREIHQRILNHT